jgi:hypothetical protein
VANVSYECRGTTGTCQVARDEDLDAIPWGAILLGFFAVLLGCTCKKDKPKPKEGETSTDDGLLLFVDFDSAMDIIADWA